MLKKVKRLQRDGFQWNSCFVLRIVNDHAVAYVAVRTYTLLTESGIKVEVGVGVCVQQVVRKIQRSVKLRRPLVQIPHTTNCCIHPAEIALGLNPMCYQKRPCTSRYVRAVTTFHWTIFQIPV